MGEQIITFLFFSQQMHELPNNRSQCSLLRQKLPLRTKKHTFQKYLRTKMKLKLWTYFVCFFLHGWFINENYCHLSRINFYPSLKEVSPTKPNRAAANKVWLWNVWFVIFGSLFKVPVCVALTFNLSRCDGSLCFRFHLTLWLLSNHSNITYVAIVCVCVYSYCYLYFS